MYLVSVLVPVYKVEPYIERCARSLFEQTYPELEYIFVDDCTTDKSIFILKDTLLDYPLRSSRVKIIKHELNRGLAASRNTALDNASGEFVCAVDSDDWLEINAIELLVNRQQETHADIVAGSMMMHQIDGDFPFVEKEYISKNDVVLRQLEKSWDHTVCRKLIRRFLYEQNHIRCMEGCDMTEDRYQMAQLAYFADSYALIDDIIYHYERRNEESIMAQKNKDRVLGRNYQYLRNWLGIRSFFSDKEKVYYEKASLETLLFEKQFLSIIVKLQSKQWYCRLAGILDQENPNDQELVGWTTKGVKGFYLHSFNLVEIHYFIIRVLRYFKKRLL